MKEFEQKTEVIKVRLTPALKTLVEREAQNRSQSVSAVIRWAIYEQYSAGSRQVNAQEVQSE